MAKRQKKEAPKEVQEIEKKVSEVCGPPVKWGRLRETDEVMIEFAGKDYKVSLNIAKVLMKKGLAKAK